jgi:hypothetical protein
LLSLTEIDGQWDRMGIGWFRNGRKKTFSKAGAEVKSQIVFHTLSIGRVVESTFKYVTVQVLYKCLEILSFILFFTYLCMNFFFFLSS